MLTKLAECEILHSQNLIRAKNVVHPLDIHKAIQRSDIHPVGKA
jgi:hypothetical protein